MHNKRPLQIATKSDSTYAQKDFNIILKKLPLSCMLQTDFLHRQVILMSQSTCEMPDDITNGPVTSQWPGCRGD